jgi:hypothetical protein
MARLKDITCKRLKSIAKDEKEAVQMWKKLGQPEFARDEHKHFKKTRKTQVEKGCNIRGSKKN